MAERAPLVTPPVASIVGPSSDEKKKKFMLQTSDTPELFKLANRKLPIPLLCGDMTVFCRIQNLPKSILAFSPWRKGKTLEAIRPELLGEFGREQVLPFASLFPRLWCML